MSGPQFLAALVFAVAAAMHTGTGRTDGGDAGMHGSTDRLRVRGGSGGASMPFILSRSRGGGGWLGWGGESGREEEKWKERGKHELREGGWGGRTREGKLIPHAMDRADGYRESKTLAMIFMAIKICCHGGFSIRCTRNFNPSAACLFFAQCNAEEGNVALEPTQRERGIPSYPYHYPKCLNHQPRGGGKERLRAHL